MRMESPRALPPAPGVRAMHLFSLSFALSLPFAFCCRGELVCHFMQKKWLIFIHTHLAALRWKIQSRPALVCSTRLLASVCDTHKDEQSEGCPPPPPAPEALGALSEDLLPQRSEAASAHLALDAPQ